MKEEDTFASLEIEEPQGSQLQENVREIRQFFVSRKVFCGLKGESEVVQKGRRGKGKKQKMHIYPLNKSRKLAVGSTFYQILFSVNGTQKVRLSGIRQK